MQSAEYSHLAPRNEGGGESNDFYDLGPQQRGQQHGVGDGSAVAQVEYAEIDSNV